MIRNLITWLSQHVCHDLMVAGLVASTLTISGASNATPIVVTTTTPHLLTRDATVFISGVTGNTAANDYWQAFPLTANTFALKNGDGTDSVGNGNYVNGGTAQTALIGGRILLGRWWVQQNQTRPRIVAIPIDADGLPRDHYAMAEKGQLSEPQRDALLSPSVSTVHNCFEIQVWGGQNPPDRDFDFDATELMRDQVIRSCDALFRGNFTWGKGKWIDQQEKATVEMPLGHLFVFQLFIDASIGLTPESFSDSDGFTIDVYGNNTGTSELAAEIIK